MTRAADWYAHYVTIDPVDTADALQAALADPQQRWYGLRRVQALAAAGALTADAAFNPNLHPRGRDGKFIEKFGWVRWFDPDTMKWSTGWVSDIRADDGRITVQSAGGKYEFDGGKFLYARPKPKATLTLPDPVNGTVPDKFAKIGGQGGSNPGGLYQVDGSYANQSADISKHSKMTSALMPFAKPGTDSLYPEWNPDAEAVAFMPADIDVVMLPRVDGTLDRYDVIQRFGSKWYRVPASGQMTDDDLMRADLEVSPEDAFGAPDSPRRKKVIGDLGSMGVARGEAFDVEDVADMVQQSASPLPQVGDQFYVKKMNTPERARSEALANEFYELLGVPVPDVAVGGDGKTVSSKIVAASPMSFNPNNAEHVKAAQGGFVGDAWLANWDVVGQGYDNMLVDDGVVWRVDAGGSLEYRAKGKPKGPMFGDKVGELDSLRDTGLNPTASKVFGGITKAQLDEQGTLLASITPKDIQHLADKHDMGHLGPVLIARRKDILDQLGISEPPAPDLEPPKATIPSNVKPVLQVGSPPAVSAANHALTMRNLPTYPVISENWDDPDFVANHVLVHDDDLWIPDGPPTQQSWSEGHIGKYRNLFTGETKEFNVYDGERVLSDYDASNAIDLAEQLTPSRELAKAEIVARADGTPLNELDAWNLNKNSDPSSMSYGTVGVGNWAGLQAAWQDGRLGETGPEGAADWPLLGGDATYGGFQSLWEVVAFNEDGVRLRRRDMASDPPHEMDLTPDSFNQSQWHLPWNDTTAEVWKSKYASDPHLDSDLDPDGKSLELNAKILAHQEGAGDVLAFLGPDGGVNVPGDDDPMVEVPSDEGGGKTIWIPKSKKEAYLNAEWSPGMDTDWEKVWDATENKDLFIPKDKVAPWMAGLWKPGQVTADNSDAELEAILADEQAIADKMADSTAGSNQKTVHGVLAGLSPGTPILSTEMAVTDIDALKSQLVGKSVILLPTDSYDNPDWEAKGLDWRDGIGTVVGVDTTKKWDYSTKPSTLKDYVRVEVTKPGLGYSVFVISLESSTDKKVIIPIETPPIVQQVTLKKNGDIVINGVKVGFYDDYLGIIDGDHSLTGKPMSFEGYQKSSLRLVASSLVVPIPPKPTKPKSTKVYATEAEIKDLEAKMAGIDAAINEIETALANVGKAGPAAGEGNPLNDGTKPVKGDWVFSVKDGSYAQVLNPNVVGFAGKGVLSPDMIKVKIQDPVTGKWKQSNRKRDQLVSSAGPGAPPFVMQTKAIKDSSGDYWIGPGTTVSMYDGTAGAKVLDTTVDGKVKIDLGDGTQKWVTSKDVFVYKLSDEPTLKAAPGTPIDQDKVDSFNAGLASLNDSKAALAVVMANTVLGKPKKKKPIGVPYPGPAGATYKQPPSLAEAREAKGLKNMKDGYAATTGMVVRHNDGTQYVVYDMGDEWSSHKNSVMVAPVGSPYDFKWRALSTMVVDHEAMLTDAGGNALPIVSKVEGGDWLPESAMILSKPYKQSYYQKDAKGKSQYREKTIARFFFVDPHGKVWDIQGNAVTANYLKPGYNSPDPPERIGYIDKNAPGGKTLTVSAQPDTKHGNLVQYAVIHDDDTPAAIPLAKQTATPPTVEWKMGDPWSPGGKGMPEFAGGSEPPPGYVLSNPGSTSPVFVPAPAEAPVPPAVAPVTAPDVPTTVSPTPVDVLPAFTGTNPQGQELPHPPTVKSSAGVPPFKVTGGTPTLDKAGLAGAHSVTDAVAQTLSVAADNKKNGTKKWVGTYGLGDHDVIEDMMVRSQTVRDDAGVEYVEVSFRLDIPAARKAHKTFITSTMNETGDWETNPRNAKNLVPGDKMAVRIASGGGVAPKGALRPDENATVPNATVTAAPVLIGKNAKGTLDVYRTQVMTASGDVGYVDLEDRNGADTVVIMSWDAMKPRTSNGAKGLNPNAKDDGWSAKTNQLSWSKSTQWQQSDIGSDGVKKVGTNPSTSTPGPGGGTSESEPLGDGYVLQRDYDGVHIEYATSPSKNALDGHTVIRVRADDPDAQRKIADAMELVGVSREKQQPPDKAALTDMALQKVYEQFSKTYTRGMKPNSAEQALATIDEAVGAHMPPGPDGKPRKATMDDLSLRIAKDGRVQVLVSEDVSKAIVATSGVKKYTHTFQGKNRLEMVEAVMAGESPSILSTTERFQHGLWYTGMSSGSDHKYDSADNLFFSLHGSGGSGSATVDGIAMHRQLDYYHRDHDSMGERHSDNLSWLHASGGELMIQRRFEADQFAYITLTESDRDTVIKRLHKRGITTAPNGKPLESFLVSSSIQPAKSAKFPDEIKLTSIPEDGSVVAPAAPAMAVV